MKTLDNTYFNPSGCLTEQALADYVFDRLNEADKSLIQAHIADCQFCADAVEGASLIQSKDLLHQNIDKLRERLPKSKKRRAKNSANQPGTVYVAVASIAAAILVMIYLFSTFQNVQVNAPVSAFGDGIMDLYPTTHRPAPPENKPDFASPINESDKAGNIYFESIEADKQDNKNMTQIKPQQPIGSKPIRTTRKRIADLRTLHHQSKKMENKTVKEFQLIFPVDKPRYGYSYDDQDVVIARFIENDVKEKFTLPSFRMGGVEPFLHYIKKNIKYPQEAIDKEIAGTVMVDFTINEYGKLVGARVNRGVHPLLDNEALRVISESPTWIPGSSNGSATSVNFTCPVEFRLSKR